jgi:hypothetical protein
MCHAYAIPAATVSKVKHATNQTRVTSNRPGEEVRISMYFAKSGSVQNREKCQSNLDLAV